MSITTHVQALTTALNAIDNHWASMLDHGVTPDQYKAIEPDLIAGVVITRVATINADRIEN